MKKIIVILGVAAVSFSSIFVKFSDAPGIVMAFYRMGFSALITVPVALFKDRNRIRSLSKKHFALSALSGILLGLHFAFFFTALSYTSVTACTCLIDMEAVLVPIIMFIFMKEHQGLKKWLSIAVALSGALILTFSDGIGNSTFTGNMLALCAGIVVSVYTVLGNICRRDMTTSLYTAIVYLFASVTTFITALFMKENVFSYSAKNVILGLALAVVCTLLGHSVFSWGLKYERPSFISVSKLLEPVFATVLALILIKGETFPKPVTVAGAVLVIGGTILFSVFDKKQNLSITNKAL